LQKKLTSIIPAAGASARNPVDVANPFPQPAVLRGVMETVCTDSDIDILIVDELEMGMALLRAEGGATMGSNMADLVKVPVEIKEKYQKPVVMVLPVEATGTQSIEAEAARRKVCDYYLQNGIAVFLTLQRAADAIVRLASFYGSTAD
jgi:hypothetical protein